MKLRRLLPTGMAGDSILVVSVLAWLWFRCISFNALEWSSNVQYSYGWAVPFLCGYLFYGRVRTSAAEVDGPAIAPKAGRIGALSLSVIGILLLLYFPVRLVGEANPDWRLVSWALALLAISFTLAVLPLSSFAGKGSVGDANSLSSRKYLFPALFFLVAVPWPSFIEQPAVTALTRANAAGTVELLNLVGIPAFQEGNLVQVATGLVGIDEACSGIRSFQATLMISLFLGEVYRLTTLKRLLCVAAGFGFSFLFNIGRTTLLSWVAAKKGTGAVASWHDPAGATIVVGCFVALWGTCMFLRRRHDSSGETSPPACGNGTRAACDAKEHPAGRLAIGRNRRRFLIAAMACWVVLAEAGVYAWYWVREGQLPPPVGWNLRVPTDKQDLKSEPVSAGSMSLLKADEAHRFSWREGSLNWQVIYLEWKPGKPAGYLSKVHNPQTCQTASGFSMVSMSAPQVMEVKGLSLPFRKYVFTRGGVDMLVFYFLWDDRLQEKLLLSEGNTAWRNRLRAVWMGRGNSGQRVLELAMQGYENPAEAQELARKRLGELIEPLAKSGERQEPYESSRSADEIRVKGSEPIKHSEKAANSPAVFFAEEEQR